MLQKIQSGVSVQGGKYCVALLPDPKLSPNYCATTPTAAGLLPVFDPPATLVES